MPVESVKCQECSSGEVTEFKHGSYVCGHRETVFKWSAAIALQGAAASCACGRSAAGHCQSCATSICNSHGRMWSEKFYCGECDPYAIGARLVGTVVLTKPIGAYISLASGIDGLLHISEIRKLIGGRRVVSVDDVVTIGSELLVEVIEVEQSGLIRLSPVLSVTEPTGG